jgi:hypothetical protein
MKGAECPEARAGPFQGKVTPDDIHDITGFGDFLDALLGDTWHGENLEVIVKGGQKVKNARSLGLTP